jgi:hypothetical protein
MARLQRTDLWVTEGIRTISPRTDETYTIDVSGMLVNSGAPSAPAAVLHLKVDDGDDTAATLQDQPVAASATTLTQRVRGFAVGEYELHITFVTSGNVREVTVPFVSVE